MNKVFLTAMAALVITAVFLWQRAPAPPHNPVQESSARENSAAESIADAGKLKSFLRRESENARSDGKWLESVKASLQEKLFASQYKQALRIFDDAYSRASSGEVEQLQAILLNHAALLVGQSNHAGAVQLLSLYTENHNDLDAWRMLASAYQANKQWRQALDALLHNNQLEVETDRYQSNLRKMVRVASELNTDHQRNGDLLASLALYKRLYEQYPQHPRFQYDLAQAQLALGAFEDARALLQSLSYDPDLGTLAAQQLAILEADSQAVPKVPDQNQIAPPGSGRNIVVPLIRDGTSLLVETKIDGHNSRLLLDTGASVTALSSQRIAQLGLLPTGQRIRINTANGTTSSQLFRAESLTMGRVTFRDLLIAEIDLASSGIDGLLGTDVLRSMGDDFSYVIDDEQNALIFRARP